MANDKRRKNVDLIVFSLLFAMALVITTYLSSPENNYWLAPGATMFMILLLSISIDKWWFLGRDDEVTKNLSVILAILVLPSVVSGALGIKTSQNVYNYWRAIILPLYLGHAFYARKMDSYAVVSIYSVPLIIMLAMIFSIQPLPNVKIPKTSINNNT